MRSLTGARGARVAHRAYRTRDEGDDNNHQESVMGGEVNAPGGNVWVVGGAPPTVISGAEFMQGVFTIIEQVVRNTVQEMLMPARATDTRAAIGKALNETRRITNPKSHREGTSIQPKGYFLKKLKSSKSQQQYSARFSPTISVVSFGQTSRGGPICFGCHQPGHRVAGCPLKGQ